MSESAVSERYASAEMGGSLVEAEHLARYRWAAALAEGRRALDAGCGEAYGCGIIAEAGATEVVGVDRAATVLETARPRMPDHVRLLEGEVEELAFPPASFELVVCFEVIEYVPDPDRVLDELRRVLAPGGVLAISAQNPQTSPPGNPYRLRELAPEELQGLLASRFDAVRLYHQLDWITSAIRVADDRLEPREGISFHAAAEPPGDKHHTVALAGDHPLRKPPPLAVATGIVEMRAWLEQSAALEEENRRLATHIVELQQINRERLDAQRQLARAEGELSKLREAVSRAEQQLGTELGRAGELRRQRDNLLGSRSWRLAAPLRAARRILRGRKKPHP